MVCFVSRIKRFVSTVSISANTISSAGFAIASLLPGSCDETSARIALGDYSACGNQALFWCLFLASCIMLWVAVRAEKQRQDQKESGSINLEKQYRDYFETEMIAYSENFGLGPDARVSLYKHERKMGFFRLLARHADNHQYDETGRAMYPDEEGCIGVALRNNQSPCYVDQLPDPARDYGAYKTRLRTDYKMTAATVDDLKMKSRALCACAIKHRTSHEVMAVLVVETTESVFHMRPTGVQPAAQLSPDRVQERLCRQANRLALHLMKYLDISDNMLLTAVQQDM